LKPAWNSIFNLNQKRSSHFRILCKRVTSFPFCHTGISPQGIATTGDIGGARKRKIANACSDDDEKA
jgi:hypothetical protein